MKHHYIKTLINYKGNLIEDWLEVVAKEPEYIMAYQSDTEIYYNIDRRHILDEFEEPVNVKT